MEPGQIFDMLIQRSSNPNATSISLNDDALRSMREPLNEWAKRTGFSGTSITRDQFVEYGKSPEAEKYRSNLMSRFGGGSRSGGPGGPGSPQAPGTPTTPTSGQPGTVVVIGGGGSGSGSPMVTTQQPMSGGDRGGDRGGWGGDRGGSSGGRATYEFGRRDQNGDGVLTYDEMSDTLKGEREKWDMNHDGVVNQDEYSAYFQAFQARQNDPNQGGGFGQGGYGDRGGYGGDRGGYGGDRGGWGGDQGSYGPQQTDNQSATKQEEKKAVVYRAGKLPENVPGWFKDLDRDLDGQVALYEWKAKDKVVSEFTGMDRNGDGFITFQEAVLATTKPQTGGTAVVSADKKPGESGRTGLFGGFGSRGGSGGSDPRSSGGTSPSFGGNRDSGSKDSSSKDKDKSKDSSSKDKDKGTSTSPSTGQSQTDRWIDSIFKGKDTLVLEEQKGFGSDRLKEWVKKKGITTPTITKDQYKEYLEEQRNSRGQGGGMTPGGGGFGRPGGGTPGGGMTPGSGGFGNTGGGDRPRR